MGIDHLYGLACPNTSGFALLDNLIHLQTKGGWYAGLFEADMSANEILTLNTNAVVLEALHYKAFGPLVK